MRTQIEKAISITFFFSILFVTCLTLNVNNMAVYKKSFSTFEKGLNMNDRIWDRYAEILNAFQKLFFPKKRG